MTHRSYIHQWGQRGPSLNDRKTDLQGEIRVLYDATPDRSSRSLVQPSYSSWRNIPNSPSRQSSFLHYNATSIHTSSRPLASTELHLLAANIGDHQWCSIVMHINPASDQVVSSLYLALGSGNLSAISCLLNFVYWHCFALSTDRCLNERSRTCTLQADTYRDPQRACHVIIKTPRSRLQHFLLYTACVTANLPSLLLDKFGTLVPEL